MTRPEFLWPLADLPKLVTVWLAERGLGSDRRTSEHRPPPGGLELDDWFRHTMIQLDHEGTITPLTFEQLFGSTSAPRLIRLEGEKGFLFLVRTTRNGVLLACPSGSTTEITLAELKTALGLAPPDLSHVQDSALRRFLAESTHGQAAVGFEWNFRRSLSSPWWALLREYGVPGAMAQVVGLSVLHVACMLLGWVTIVRASLYGHVELGWAAAWSLLLVSEVVFRYVASTARARLQSSLGTLLRRRAMFASLQLPLKTVRTEGVGGLLGRVLELENIEEFVDGALSFGILGIIFGFFASLWMAQVQGWILLLWIAVGPVLFLVGLRLRAARREWSRARQRLTQETLDSILGHRTFAVQGLKGDTTIDEAIIAHYHTASKRFDAARALLDSLPKLWLLCALAALVPSFIAREPRDSAFAFAIVAVLLGQRAVQLLSRAVYHATGAWVSLDASKESLRATKEPSSPLFVPKPKSAQDIQLRQVSYSYPGTRRIVLDDVTLGIGETDKALVVGPSGSGKSTLASVLSGLRSPDAGLVLAGGLDSKSIGPGPWRNCVALAPQFHENHIFSGTLLFNLLLARQWPPTMKDVQIAEQLCRELGLEELIQRMPAGLLQMVGDSGWQLSHGERSRVFLARAILQNASLTILDESFAAMDPETLSRCVKVARDRTHALMIIAHP